MGQKRWFVALGDKIIVIKFLVVLGPGHAEKIIILQSFESSNAHFRLLLLEII